MDFAATIIKWYDLNYRKLPWRDTKNPYQIWLSEVILQQTRVDQGMRYYHHFCEKYPTISDLALSSEDEILKSWQGLGYYSRARNLHKTAQFIHHELKGKFPDTYEKLIQLKGIGPYTAAAISSFAFGEKKAVVDGNVNRVIARYFGIDTPIDSSLGKKTIQALVDDLIPSKNPGKFNQAIMEFGAMFCIPSKPDCLQCPLKDSCTAFRKNKVNILPVKSKKTTVKDVYLLYVLIRRGNYYFVQKRDDSSIWKNMYELPVVEAERSLTPGDILKLIKLHKLTVPKSEILIHEAVKHQLSHRTIHAHFAYVNCLQTIHPHRNWVKVKWGEHPKGAIPRLIERYLDSIFDSDREV